MKEQRHPCFLLDRWLLKVCWFWLLLFPISAWSSFNNSVHFTVSGLDSPLKKNVLLYLEAMPEIEPNQLTSMFPQIKKTVAKGLMALGYYRPSIKMAINGNNPNRMNIVVDAGLPVLIRTLNVELTGDALQDEAFEQLLKTQPLKKGDVMNDGQYESMKDQLNNLAQSRGYFDAKLTEHSVKVYPAQQAADIQLELDSGRRYAFGELHYGTTSQATQQLLAPLINFKEGEPFQYAKLNQLNLDFSSTDYFNQIDIQPLIKKANGNHVPIFIQVTPKTYWQVETGIGFSTDEGPRISLTLDRPWMNDKGHSLSSDAKASKKVMEISAQYKIPYGNPILEYYSLESSYQKKKSGDTDSGLFSSSVHQWTKRPNNWGHDLFLRLEFERYTQGMHKNNTHLLIPGVAFSRRQFAGNSMDPTSGSLYSVTLETSAKAWKSSASFIKLWWRGKWLTTLDKKHRLLGRIEQGSILINNINDIPPSIRFFTGGDQSVRGFKYESISPKDASGKLTGAKYMSAISAEYNYEFIENWRLAAFIDSGIATNKSNSKWKTGAGFGIRWVTPLGPLKLDLAFAISEEGSPFRIHFSMGPDI